MQIRNKMKDGNKLISGVDIISMVVPSVNGNQSNLIVLSSEKYNKMRIMADDLTIPNKKYFALFCDATVYHELLNTRFGGLTKEQFDEVIKDEYNSTLQVGKRIRPLKKIK